MKRCAFCDCEAKLTAEHLQSDWINRLLEERTHHYVISQKEGPDTEWNKWKSSTLNLKAKVACAECNNGWMSDLENDEARPLLKDLILHSAPVSFLPKGVASLAAFAMKNGFIADYISPSPHQFFDVSTRKTFVRTLRPPAGVHMWFGALRHPKGRRHGIYKTRYGKPRVTTEDSVESFVFTCSIESLLLQVACVRWAHASRRRALHSSLNQEARLDDLFVPFWPPNVTIVTWPPPQYILSDDVDSVANRFTDVTITYYIPKPEGDGFVPPKF